jgi:hypothetical protein
VANQWLKDHGKKMTKASLAEMKMAGLIGYYSMTRRLWNG